MLRLRWSIIMILDSRTVYFSINVFVINIRYGANPVMSNSILNYICLRVIWTSEFPVYGFTRVVKPHKIGCGAVTPISSC